jgi:hypothetical protein
MKFFMIMLVIISSLLFIILYLLYYFMPIINISFLHRIISLYNPPSNPTNLDNIELNQSQINDDLQLETIYVVYHPDKEVGICYKM